MAQVSAYAQADFPAILKWQALAFMRVEWPFIFSGPGKFATETYPPEAHPLHFAATEGDTLLSYATVMHLSLEHSSTTYQLCGFGNLFTFPPYRHEGYGQRVLELATRYIRHSNADIAGLFCDSSLEGFYARCGWEVVGAPTYVGQQGSYHEYDAIKMMLFISTKGETNKQAFFDKPLYISDAW